MILPNIPKDFWHKRKIDNFDPNYVLLAISTNITVILMTGFVLQGHIVLTLLMYFMKAHIFIEYLL